MPNRNLNATDLLKANDLLTSIRERLTSLAGGDQALLFAFRRKVAKELGYDERSKSAVRKIVKAVKWKEQNGLCAE